MHNNELYHYGITGMKWGVRRYQDKNGRLTEAGKARLASYSSSKDTSDIRKSYTEERSKINDSDRLEQNYLVNKYIREYAKTALRDLRMDTTDSAVASANRFLRQMQLKKDVDDKPEINDLVKSGYKLNIDDSGYDCSVTKKLNDVDLEISIVNRSDGIARIMDKPSDFVKSANKTLEKEFASNDLSRELYKVYGKYAADGTRDQGEISEHEFMNRVQPYYVRVSQINGRKICEVGFDDDDMLGGHSLDLEFDLDAKKRKYYHSMNG